MRDCDRPIPVLTGHDPRRRWILLGLGCVMLAGIWAPVRGQEFGQWTWDASLGAKGQSFTTGSGGQKISESRFADLGLSLGMNGYIVHPTFAHFRLGADFLFSDTTVEGRDNNSLGLHAALDLLPRGAVPSTFFFTDRQYNYEDLSTSDPLTSLSLPNHFRSYGATVRSRQGPLVGMSFSARRKEIDFFEPGVRQEVDQSERFMWGRGFGRFRHTLRLEHIARVYGAVDLEFDDLIGSLSERGQITEKWDWDMTASAFRRDFISETSANTRTQQGQFRNRFRRDIRDREWFEIIQSSTRTQIDDAIAENTHSLTASWNRPLNDVWVIGPFANYSRLTGDLRQVDSPRLGVFTNWQDRGEHLDGTINARASYGIVEASLDTETSSTNNTALSFSGILGHGAAQGGLRKELLVQVSRNALRLERELLSGLPDPALPVGGLGLENVYSARLTLRYHWSSRQLSGWGEWRLRNLNNELSGLDSAIEGFWGTLQFNTRTFQVMADANATRVDHRVAPDEDTLTAGLSARWRPWRLVTLRGLYRRIQRNLVLSPDVDGGHLNIGVDVQLGQTLLRVGYLEVRDRHSGGTRSIRRNVIWSISRRFGGLLPVRTGKARRGTIN